MPRLWGGSAHMYSRNNQGYKRLRLSYWVKEVTKRKTDTIWYHLYVDSKIWHKFKRTYLWNGGFPGGASNKEPACQCRRREMQVWSLGREDPLEEGMAPHSSIPAWRIPWTEEPSGLQSIGSQRVGHDWSDLACMHTSMKQSHGHRE